MKWQIVVDGRVADIHKDQLESAIEVEPGVYSVLIEGRSFEIRVLPRGAASIVEAEGRRFNVEVRDPRNASRSSRSALGGGRQNVTAPMPGKIIRVLVNNGDAVESGQGLVVVEAMKMQNDMKAPRAAQVIEVRVGDGDTVAAGETLVVLE